MEADGGRRMTEDGNPQTPTKAEGEKESHVKVWHLRQLATAAGSSRSRKPGSQLAH